jgi:hypothetical protein
MRTGGRPDDDELVALRRVVRLDVPGLDPVG